jgi:hypothetical protein
LLSFEIRNEALETHYINHLELIEIYQKPEWFSLPAVNGVPLSLDNFVNLNRAVNKAGEDLLEKFLKPDDNFYSTNEMESPDELNWDFIELEFDPQTTENMALHIRARNTLFSTVLLYDFLLAGRGIDALNWLSSGLETVSEVVALGDFYQRYTGIRIDQKINGEYHEIGRIKNVGPIAWKDLALEFQNYPESGNIQLRLRFLSDTWQIDQLRLATSVLQPQINRIPVSMIKDQQDNKNEEVKARVLAADQLYLITYPGQKFTVSFQTSNPPPGMEPVYFLGTRGYYTEWMRADWIRDPDPFFKPDYSEKMMMRVQKQWMSVKDDFEKTFFETKIPVQ